MIIDASAIVAILLGEPQADRLLEILNTASSAELPASAYLEAIIVLSRFEAEPHTWLADFLLRHGIELIGFGAEAATVAGDAFLRYGKGRHPAQLNFGDCMAYAVAKLSGQPLLFVGGDFAKTDIEAA